MFLQFVKISSFGEESLKESFANVATVLYTYNLSCVNVCDGKINSYKALKITTFV